MNTSKHLFLLAVILLLSVVPTDAQETMPEQPAPKYRMQLVHIFETEATEFIFVVGNSGFKSIDSLKAFVNRLPAGSTLEWAPGCKRSGDEPLLSSEEAMDDFKAFCAERNINFILVPSG